MTQRPRRRRSGPGTRAIGRLGRRVHDRRPAWLWDGLEARTLLSFSSVITSNSVSGFVTITGDTLSDTLQIDKNGTLLQHNTITAPAGEAYADNLDFNSTDINPSTSNHVTDGTFPVSIQGGGNDQIILGDATTPASSLQTVFSVTGTTGGNDTLTIDDSADTTGRTITIDIQSQVATSGPPNVTGTVAFSGGPTFSFRALSHVTVIGGTGGNTINVLNTPTNTALTVETNGADTINVGNNGTLAGIGGPVDVVTVSGGAPQLNVNGGNDNTSTATLAASSLTGVTAQPITFGGAKLAGLSIQDNINTTTITGTPAAPVTFDDPNAAGTVNVEATSGPLSILDASVLNLGNPGTLADINGLVQLGKVMILNVDDSTDTTGRSPVLRDGGNGIQIEGLNPGGIQFGGSGTTTDLSITGGQGDDTLTVQFPPGGEGINPIPSGGLRFDGGPGANSLVLQGGSFQNEEYDAFGPGAGTIFLDASFISFTNLRPITDTSPAVNYTFDAPNGGTATNLSDGPVVGGLPTLRIASGDTPAGFERVDLANKQSVTINAAGVDISIVTPQVVSVNNPTTAAGLTSLTVLTGSGDDTVNLTATPPGVVTSVNTGAGNDTVNAVAAGLGAGGSDNVDGGAGTDTLSVDAGGKSVDVATPGVVAVSGDTPLGYANFEAVHVFNAADRPLTPVPTVINTNVGTFLDNVVAGSFTDADTGSQPADFTVTIDWGDGSPSTTGTVVIGPAGGYNVLGSHAYAVSGTFVVLVHVLDTGSTDSLTVGGIPVTVSDNGGQTTDVRSQANVGRSTLTVSATNVQAAEGVVFIGTVATFTDTNSLSVPGDFTATIDWGDGTTSSGTVSRTEGPFVITGSHTYADEGQFTVAVFVSGRQAQTPPVPAVSFAAVADTDVLSQVVPGLPGPQGPSFGATEGVPFSGTVVTIANKNLANQGSDFLATINWGDGTSSAGTVSGMNGLYHVLGTHTYAEEGAYHVTVFITDDPPKLPEAGGPPPLASLTAAATAFVSENFLVTNANDSGPGSLRDLILDLNGDRTGGTITFAIPGPGSHVIHLVTPLPAIDVPVLIDGRTQPGFAGKPLVVLNGDGLAAGDGLTLNGGLSTVLDLVIDGFRNGVGVVLEGPGVDTIENCYIGTSPSGESADPNFQGVLVLGSSSNFIGPGNVISGNLSAGIQIFNSLTVSDPTLPLPSPGPATRNVISGNVIGLGAFGRVRLPNAQGIFINDAAGNTIGGNVISGNRSIGVQVLGDHATNNVLTGNTVRGNNVGVFLYSAPGNVIGSNDIAFNPGGGVRVRNLNAGPEVESVSLQRDAAGNVTGILLLFTTYLDRGRASNPANYVVSFVGRNLRLLGADPVTSAIYNGIYRTVFLTLGTPISPSTLFQLRVVGRSPSGLTDRVGNFLDGSSILPPPRGGSDFLAFFRQGSRIQGLSVSAATPATGQPVRVLRASSPKTQGRTGVVPILQARRVTARPSALAVDALSRSGELKAHTRRRP